MRMEINIIYCYYSDAIYDFIDHFALLLVVGVHLAGEAESMMMDKELRRRRWGINRSGLNVRHLNSACDRQNVLAHHLAH